MEEELVSDSSEGEDHQRPPSSASAIFDEHLPYYLAIGMPYALFWSGDCTAVIAYRKAYEIQRRRDERDLWRQGMYVYEAVLDAVPVLRAFAKAGTKPLPYPTEPYPVTVRDAQEKEERREREEYENQQRIMEQWMIDVRRAREGKEVPKDG
ncbi:MAG: hypothetical protein ILO42_04750 [Clostridia bacterium]|nr:hypothetical protein [Clostridia bacterium]MBP5270250.1 hypothetical protein [Clostridia bacterium]